MFPYSVSPLSHGHGINLRPGQVELHVCLQLVNHDKVVPDLDDHAVWHQCHCPDVPDVHRNLRVRHVVLQEPFGLKMLLNVPSEVDGTTDDHALWEDIPNCLYHGNLKVHV